MTEEFLFQLKGILCWSDMEFRIMAQDCVDAARKVDLAKVHLRWCIESGESECGLRVAWESLVIADKEFDQAISEATIEQREAFIISIHVDPAPP